MDHLLETDTPTLEVYPFVITEDNSDRILLVDFFIKIAGDSIAYLLMIGDKKIDMNVDMPPLFTIPLTRRFVFAPEAQQEQMFKHIIMKRFRENQPLTVAVNSGRSWYTANTFSEKRTLDPVNDKTVYDRFVSILDDEFISDGVKGIKKIYYRHYYDNNLK